jgi:hypothetical protein
MTRRRNHPADSYCTPFALWNPLAAEGAAQALGSTLRNTSAFVLMLATSRTPAQWITGQLGRTRPKEQRRDESAPAAATLTPQ